MNATHTPTRFVHSSILPSPRLARSAAENKKTVTKTSTSLKALKKNNKVYNVNVSTKFEVIIALEQLQQQLQLQYCFMIYKNEKGKS